MLILQRIPSWLLWKTSIHSHGRPLQLLEIPTWRELRAIGEARGQSTPGFPRPFIWTVTFPLRACVVASGEFWKQMEAGALEAPGVGWPSEERAARSGGPSLWQPEAQPPIAQAHFLVLISHACGPGPGVCGAEDACMGVKLRCTSQAGSVSLASPSTSCSLCLVFLCVFFSVFWPSLQPHSGSFGQVCMPGDLEFSLFWDLFVLCFLSFSSLPLKYC